MTNDLYLKYNGGDGSMVILMDEFFPCTKGMLKDLIARVINHMDGWDSHNKAINTLEDYFYDQIQLCELEINYIHKELDYKTSSEYIAKKIKPWEKRKQQFTMLYKYMQTVKRW